MQRNGLLIAISLLAVLVNAGCGRGSPLRTWSVDSLVKVFPDDRPGTNELSGGTWFVARNGHVHIQIALRSDQPVPHLAIDLKPP
ncbi:MAG: hypothetical protein HXY24_12140 [Rubrivivax sp.]|nr:hypothetical protein [Rubrivivax sp.]